MMTCIDNLRTTGYYINTCHQHLY